MTALEVFARAFSAKTKEGEDQQQECFGKASLRLLKNLPRSALVITSSFSLPDGRRKKARQPPRSVPLLVRSLEADVGLNHRDLLLQGVSLRFQNWPALRFAVRVSLICSPSSFVSSSHRDSLRIRSAEFSGTACTGGF
jgi:hypothetical protein